MADHRRDDPDPDRDRAGRRKGCRRGRDAGDPEVVLAEPRLAEAELLGQAREGDDLVRSECACRDDADGRRARAGGPGRGGGGHVGSRIIAAAVFSTFTRSHRGGSGPPLVCLHGFMATWRTWKLVLPMLEAHHDVLAPTLAGHAGGPPLAAQLTDHALADGVERAMDEAGIATAQIVGNSLGGFVALQLAARGRADSVVAFAPAGGWAEGDGSIARTLVRQRELQLQVRAAAPIAPAMLASVEGRRQATALLTTSFEHIPVELLVDQLLAVAACTGAGRLIDFALREGYDLDAERIACPVRVVWGTADKLLEWPSTAARYRRDWLPHADWIELDGVGHCPQLDVPLEAAQLILGFATGT
jgi:pimeloyl-ACP methyl ester carboxylesterase